MAGPLEGRSAWVVTEGHAGAESQGLALAGALGLDPEIKRVSVHHPWAWCPVSLWPAPLFFARAGGAPLAPPWPDILITVGRRSAALGIAIGKASRRAGGPGTFTVQIHNPQVMPTGLDVVITPRHDLENLRRHGQDRPNVITTLGSLHPLDPRCLAAEAEKVRAKFEHLPRPLVTVLVGGPSRSFRIRMDAGSMEALGAALRRLQARTRCSLAVLTSRRTGDTNAAALKRTLEGTEAYVWDGHGDNPYRGLLGLADGLVVTCDSVNMVSEAAATGKPLYVAMFEGRSGRIEAFHREMRTLGHARAFEGEVDFGWSPPPLLETPRIAAEIAARFAAARGADRTDHQADH